MCSANRDAANRDISVTSGFWTNKRELRVVSLQVWPYSQIVCHFRKIILFFQPHESKLMWFGGLGRKGEYEILYNVDLWSLPPPALLIQGSCSWRLRVITFLMLLLLPSAGDVGIKAHLLRQLRTFFFRFKVVRFRRTFPWSFTRCMLAKLPTGFYFYFFLLLCDGANADCTA